MSMLSVHRLWMRGCGISGDWWPQYRRLSRRQRVALRKRVWDGRAETDPKLLPIAAAFATWSTGARMVGFHRIALLLATLVFGFFLGLIIGGIPGLAVGAAFVVLYYGSQSWFDMRRTDRARKAAALNQSALKNIRPAEDNAPGSSR
jgi:hypothetical protein